MVGSLNFDMGKNTEKTLLLIANEVIIACYYGTALHEWLT
jgi:hypothetical protein